MPTDAAGGKRCQRYGSTTSGPAWPRTTRLLELSPSPPTAPMVVACWRIAGGRRPAPRAPLQLQRPRTGAIEAQPLAVAAHDQQAIEAVALFRASPPVTGGDCRRTSPPSRLPAPPGACRPAADQHVCRCHQPGDASKTGQPLTPVGFPTALAGLGGASNAQRMACASAQANEAFPSLDGLEHRPQQRRPGGRLCRHTCGHWPS